MSILGGKGGGKGSHKGNPKAAGRKDVSKGNARNAKGRHEAPKGKGKGGAAGGGGEGRGPKGDE